MDLQFKSTGFSCLRQIVGQMQHQEQTQELRLSDGLPDIGRVLGAWGQVITRGKQWHSDGAIFNCGVMVWVLYGPEDGSGPQCVETWLPMTLKWDMVDDPIDGTLICWPLLRSVDARALSGRKLMIRANIGVTGQCWMPWEATLYEPEEVPQDVQLLKKRYPMRFAREAGEKAFALDEELTLPESMPDMEKPVRYNLQLEVTESKVLGDKAVFRGNGLLHILYRTPEGNLTAYHGEVPFSQYVQLDDDYSSMSQVQILPLVTSLEMEAGQQGRLRLKAGVSGQYMVYDVNDVTVVEDAYSVDRGISLQKDELTLPAVLDLQCQRIRAEQTAAFGSSRIADVAFYPGCIQSQQGMEERNLQMAGSFQVLYYDAEGTLQSGSTHWQEHISVPLGEGAGLDVVCMPMGKPQATPGAEHTMLRADVLMSTTATATENITAVTGLTMGEELKKDPDRPSLILRRAGKEELWDIAKAAGSTVEAITAANGLQGQPDPNKMLLIPII